MTFICENCNKSFEFTKQRINRKFCSRECVFMFWKASVNSRFWARVNKNTLTGCWTWTAGKNPGGYGHFKFNSKTITAHRFGYELQKSIKLTSEQLVLHKCDNRLCVREEHLFIGTQKDNVIDMYNKGRNNNAVGERHPETILTNNEVLEIRKSNLASRKAAKIYKVSHRTILNIRNRKTWKHLV